MTPKNRTLEGENRTLGGDGWSKIVGHHLWMIPYRTSQTCGSKELYYMKFVTCSKLSQTWKTSAVICEYLLLKVYSQYRIQLLTISY